MARSKNMDITMLGIIQKHEKCRNKPAVGAVLAAFLNYE
jgi:hypothetical protein